MPQDARALRASIDARLVNRAAETGQDVGRLRRQLVFQRILARLALDDRWVLKGGFALEVRLADLARATRDLDLAVLVDISNGDVQDVLDEALDHDVDDDGFTFAVSTARHIAPEQAGVAAWGMSVGAHLGGRRFQSVHVDVSTQPEEVRHGLERLVVAPGVDGVRLPPVSVLAVDVAQHAAEKFHALSRRYAGDRPSTRVKDLVDLVLLAEAGLLPDRRLGERLRHVHTVRDGAAPPGTIPDARGMARRVRPPGRRAPARHHRPRPGNGPGTRHLSRGDRSMSPPRSRTTTETTPQARLAAVIKVARDIMRKDAGLNGDLDRIPQFAWLLFLKAFDDLEARRAVTDRSYRPILDARFRWSEWAGDPVRRLHGEQLLTFVNHALLPYLAGLQGSGRPDDARDTLAAVFGETRNRMVSGHLLYDLIDQVNKVHFTSADDVHTMAHLYESMLREMRDAAGDSGEFYTPRPVVRFMVDRVNPQVGERVLDPAVGTGGFLVEAHEHMKLQARTAVQYRTVQESVIGVEKKPMPYLLCQMNLLLHEVDRPTVTRANALAHPLADQRRQGVDVVLTNPPFGGEEEAHIPANFPAGMRTAETSWLFLQLVMAKISKSRKGRAAVVVPNSVLFNEGVGAKIKAQLLKDFNLHTVVRLPNGVFSPYTLIPSNLLFFERGTTTNVWFYEHPLPEGRKNYTKTKPLRYEEFADCAAWWGGNDREGRVENTRAWMVPLERIAVDGYNLDLRNPHKADDLAHRPPAELVAELIVTERQILSLLQSLQADLAEPRS